MQRHLIEESVNLTPDIVGAHGYRDKIREINTDLEKFGLHIFDLSFDPKGHEFHYCVSAWYRESAYTLIDDIVKKHLKTNLGP